MTLSVVWIIWNMRYFHFSEYYENRLQGSFLKSSTQESTNVARKSIGKTDVIK